MHRGSLPPEDAVVILLGSRLEQKCVGRVTATGCAVLPAHCLHGRDLGTLEFVGPRSPDARRLTPSHACIHPGYNQLSRINDVAVVCFTERLQPGAAGELRWTAHAIREGTAVVVESRAGRTGVTALAGQIGRTDKGEFWVHLLEGTLCAGESGALVADASRNGSPLGLVIGGSAACSTTLRVVSGDVIDEALDSCASLGGGPPPTANRQPPTLGPQITTPPRRARS